MTILLNPACDSCTCSNVPYQYLVGRFSTVDDVARQNCVSLAESGAVSTAFDTGISSAVATTISSSAVDTVNRVLYLTGTVSGDGITTTCAAFDMDTGERIMAWTPAVTGALDVDYYNGYVYLAGVTVVDGSAINSACRIAAYPSAATVDGTWVVSGAWVGNTPNNITVGPSGTYVYLGGFFHSYGGNANSKGMICLLGTDASYVWSADLRRGAVSVLSGGYDIAFVDGIAYVSGYFTSATSASTARENIAAFDAATGVLQAWDAGVVCTAGFAIECVVTTSRHDAGTGEPLWIGGSITSVGGTAIAGVAKVDSGASDALDATWDMGLTYSLGTLTIVALAYDAGMVYAAGAFDAAQGSSRTRVAAMSEVGVLSTWDPRLASSSSVAVLDFSFDSDTADT